MRQVWSNPVFVSWLAGAVWAGAATAGQDPIRFRLIAGAPVVDEVYINGRGPYSFVLDTGAQMSMISEDLARRLGLQASFRSVNVTQSTNAVRDGFQLRQLRIGDVESAEEEFIAGSFEAVRKLDRAIQGTVGQSFLGKVDYLIDFQRKTLTFGTATVRGGVKAEFALANGCMVTPTSHGRLTLDSGASTLVLYDATDVRWKGEMAMSTAEGETRAKFGEVKQLQVAGQVFRNVQTSAPGRRKIDATESDGLLPANLFRSLYVCNSGGYVVFNAER